MGLLLWMGIILVILLLDRYLVVRSGHNRRRYQQKKRLRYARSR